MKNVLILATAGAGGDLQPLVAAALGLRARGHRIHVAGDAGVVAAVAGLGMDVTATAPGLELGPRLAGAVRDSLALEGAAQGEFVRQSIAAWSGELAAAIQPVVRTLNPDLLVTSLFGAGVAQVATTGTRIPWAVINSTFYVGPNPPRPVDEDFAPRAVPLIRYYLVPQLERADLVLHATDRAFDLDHADLPAGHHYVGPLLWESAGPVPAYLESPGDPWVLVTLSSQQQDDIPLGRSALNALAVHPVRVLLTVGPGHQPADLAPLPANASVESYVPHAPVLRRSRLMISHAGHGAVMKALWHGVPMLLIPWGRDQPGVAFRAERLGVARVVERGQLSEEGLAAAVHQVLDDTATRACAGAVSARLQMSDPVSTACDLLERL